MARKLQKRKVFAILAVLASIYTLLFVWNVPILFSNTVKLQPSMDLLQKLKLDDRKWPRIVVTLSSFPGRLERVKETLDSLVSQSLSPSMIYLAIPKSVERLSNVEFKEYPPFLLDFEKQHSNFKILSTIDYGPSSKLLPALLEEKDPNTILITVDDDVVYHKDTVMTISSMLLESKRHNQKIAPTWDCEEWSSWFKIPYRPYKEGICNGWVGAYSGYYLLTSAGYWRSYFHDNSVFDYSKAPKGCRLHDDVWISGILWKHSKVRPFLLRPGFNSVQSHRAWDNLTIHMVENGEKDYRDPCIEYFGGFK